MHKILCMLHFSLAARQTAGCFIVISTGRGKGGCRRERERERERQYRHALTWHQLVYGDDGITREITVGGDEQTTFIITPTPSSPQHHPPHYFHPILSPLHHHPVTLITLHPPITITHIITHCPPPIHPTLYLTSQIPPFHNLTITTLPPLSTLNTFPPSVLSSPNPPWPLPPLSTCSPLCHPLPPPLCLTFPLPPLI